MSSLKRFPRRAGVATLVERTALTPQMIRVSLRSDAFGEQWPIQHPGEIVTLLFVRPEEPVVLPTLGWRFPTGAPTQAWRNYTVRRHHPGDHRIDVDVVLHHPPGPACTWAAAAPLGSDVGFAGPRVDYVPADDTDWLLLCGDESALPAIAAILEAPPAHPALIAVVEIADATARVQLALPPGAQLRWIDRDGAPPGTTAHLVDALRGLALPDGPGQAWGAAESGVARDVRAVLRGDRGLERAHARARGYWLRTGDWLDDES